MDIMDCIMLSQRGGMERRKAERGTESPSFCVWNGASCQSRRKEVGDVQGEVQEVAEKVSNTIVLRLPREQRS